MLTIAKNLVKAKNGFLHIKDKPHTDNHILVDEGEINNAKTLDKMAKDEKNNKDIVEDKQFFSKLNDIFQKFLGPPLRRQHTYFQVDNFVEESLLKSLNYLDEEELTDYAIKILRKDIDKRLFEEIIILQKVTENVEAFKQIKSIKGREVLFTCLKNLKYKYGKMGTHIQKQNEPVRSLFIVIKGLVQVKQVVKKDEKSPKNQIVDTDQDQIIQQQTEQKNNVIRNIQNQQKHRQSLLKTGKLEKKYSFQDCLDELNSAKYFKCSYINKGQSYGDKYMLAQDDSLAENQAYLFDNCHLAYLDIIKFKTILDQRLTMKLQKEIAEFSEMNVLSTLEQKCISALFVRTKIIQLKRNNVLTKEFDRVEFVYFIKEGEVKLTKKLIYDNNQSEVIEKQKNANDKGGSFQISNKSVQNYDLAILGKGQFIGLEEFFLETKYSSSSQIYSTEATLYQISSYDFQQILSINKPSRDSIASYFDVENERDIRQERVSNFNQYIGKIDTRSKLIEDELERQNKQKNEEEIKKNVLQQGQDIIIKSNVNLNLKPSVSNSNLEFLKQSLKETRISTKKNKKPEINIGCQFTQEELLNLKRVSYVPTKSMIRINESNFGSPTKLQSPLLTSHGMSSTGIFSNGLQQSPGLQQSGLLNTLSQTGFTRKGTKSQTFLQLNHSPQKRNYINLQLTSSISDFSLGDLKKQNQATLSYIGNDDIEAIRNSYHVYPNTTVNQNSKMLASNSNLSPQFSYLYQSNTNISSPRKINNKNMKLKLDPISLETHDLNKKKYNETLEDLNNSINLTEAKSSTMEIQSDGNIFKKEGLKKLSLRLKFPVFKERKSNEYSQQDSSRQITYLNNETLQTSTVDAIQIKSFTQFANQQSHNKDQLNSESLILSHLNSSINQKSRRNSQESKDMPININMPQSPNSQKINLNRIHTRLEQVAQYSLTEREASKNKEMQMKQKKQFLPLKYRAEAILEQKDSYLGTMYQDNMKRAKIQQQAKQFSKIATNPYIDLLISPKH